MKKWFTLAQKDNTQSFAKVSVSFSSRMFNANARYTRLHLHTKTDLRTNSILIKTDNILRTIAYAISISFALDLKTGETLEDSLRTFCSSHSLREFTTSSSLVSVLSAMHEYKQFFSDWSAAGELNFMHHSIKLTEAGHELYR